MKTELRLALPIVTALCLTGPAHGRPDHSSATCARCGWTAPQARSAVRVETVEQLERAVQQAPDGATVLLAKGRYRLQRTIEVTAPGLILRGETGQRNDVVLYGGGMTGDNVGVALGIGAPDVTIADLSVGLVAYHAIQVRGEAAADNVTVHNVRLFDTGQQLLKGSCSATLRGPHNGLVACSLFEYSDTAPSDYTNGVDVLGGAHWIVRDNTFRRIRGPATGRYAAGPAILFWRRSAATTIERNLVLDSFRGIALGLADDKTGDHVGGRVRNNVVCNLLEWADEGIEANSAPNAEIDHNTVLHMGALPWAISIRFSATVAQVRNNLTNKAVRERDGGRSIVAGNIADAAVGWFVDPSAGDLHLRSNSGAAVRGGVILPTVTVDFDRRPRPANAPPDAGAFQAISPASSSVPRNEGVS